MKIGIGKIYSLSKTIMDSFFLNLLFCLCISSLLFIHFKIYEVASILFKTMFPFLFVWFVTKMVILLFDKKKIIPTRTEDKVLIIVFSLLLFSSFLSLFLSALLNNRLSSIFNGLEPFIIFVSMCFLLIIVYYGHFSKYSLLIPLSFSLLFSITMCITFLTGYSRVWSGLSSYSLLSLNFSNPNLAGIILQVLILVDIYGFFYYRKFVLKVICILTAVFLLVLFYFTSARTPLIAAVIALIISMIINLDDKKRFTLPIAIITAFIPIIFVSIYLITITTLFPDGVVSTGSSFLKDIYSRFSDWSTKLSDLSNDPMTLLFGNYYGRETLHAHNSITTLLSYCGVVSTLLFLSYLLCLLYLIIKKVTFIRLSQHMGVFFLLSFYLVGVGEAAPVLTSHGMFVFLGIGIVMVRCPCGRSVFFESPEYRRNKKKNVLLTISNVYGYGSIGKIVRTCHTKMKMDDVTSYVIYGRNRYEEETNTACIESKLEVYITKYLRKLFTSQTIGNFLMTNEILYAIKELKPNIIHITALNDDYVNYSRLLKYICKKNIKVVYTHHSEYMYLGLCGGHSYDCNEFVNGKCLNCRFKKGKKSSKVLLEKYRLFDSLNKKNLILTTSVSPWLHNRVKQSLVFRGIDDFIVTNGSDIQDYTTSFSKEELHNKEKIGLDFKVVLHVTASLANKTKKVDDVFEVAKMNPNIIFVVLSLDSNHYSNPFPNVIVKEGVISMEDLCSYYKAADVTLLTGTRETFSMPIAESLLCGTPVVAYKCGGPESVFDTEYCNFVENGDIKNLSNALNKTIEKSYNEQCIREIAINHYSDMLMVDNYKLIYKKLG